MREQTIERCGVAKLVHLEIGLGRGAYKICVDDNPKEEWFDYFNEGAKNEARANAKKQFEQDYRSPTH